MGFFKKVLGEFKDTTLFMMDKHFRAEREVLMGELSEHLHNLGLNVSLLELDSPEAFRFPPYVLGCIKIEGRNIDMLLVQIANGPYQYYYVVRANVDSLESKLKANFKSNWHDRCSQKPNFKWADKTLLEGGASSYRWEGGELAQLLNADSNLVHLLYSEGLDSLEIRPDKGRRCVRILHVHNWRSISKKDMGPGDIITGHDEDFEAYDRSGDLFTVGRKQFPTRDAFEAYDRIAYAIRRIAGSM
jgi:hypothetical protein